MKTTTKLFVGACLATCAATAPAQEGSLLDNGTFEAGNGVAVTTQFPGQVLPSSLYGWDVVTGDGPVYVKRAAIGPNGAGDASVVVYDDGSQGGISQTFASEAPYLRVTADVYVQYGGASLATTSPAGDFNLVDGTSTPNQWVTLSGVVPNPGGPNAVEILSTDANGSAFAVDNVTVEPVYDQPAATEEDQGSPAVSPTWWSASGYAPPMIPSGFSPAAAPSIGYGSLAPVDESEPVSDLSATMANLRDLSSLYEMASSYGYSNEAGAYDGGYVPSVYAWPDGGPVYDPYSGP